MTADDRPEIPFDEQKALRELDRMQQSIEAARQRRKEVIAAFDDFVRSFHRRPAVLEKSITAPSATVAEACLPEPEDLLPVKARWDSPRTARTYARLLFAKGLRGQEATAVWTKGRYGINRATALGATACLVAGGMLLIGLRSGSPDRSAASGPAPAPGADGTPAVTTPPAGAVAPGLIPAELTIVRRVWLRVTVDGARAVERELQANDRIPLRARRTIVIRTGDAGAVRLAINGRDQGPLGNDGEVVTRSFTIPPRREP